MTDSPKPSLYAIIPAFIRYAKIEPNAKLLYGEITALCEQEGYCWATNKYFAQLYEVEERTVQMWLKSLKELGAITIDNPSNFEPDRQRKIWLNGNFKKMFTERKKFQGGVKKISPSTYIYNNTTNENSPIVPTGDDPINQKKPKKRMKKMEPEVQRNNLVSTTASQHEYLLEKSGGDEDLVECWYEKLRTWKLEKQMVGGNDFKQITNWVINAVDQGNGREKRKKQNIVYAKDIYDAYPEMQISGELNISDSSLIFKRKRGEEFIKKEINFSENGFLEQVRTELSHHHAPIDRLAYFNNEKGKN